MNRLLIVALLLGTSCTPLAWSQDRWYAPAAVGWAAGGGGGYGYGFGGASTPASAAGHAMADMTRSQGVYNALTSAAMINAEQARSKYIENQKQWTEVYMMKQRIVDSERERRIAENRARNERARQEQASRPSDLPPRLTTSELDPATGAINWPAALERPDFITQRKDIEALFASRAHTGTTSEMSEQIVKKIRTLQDALRGKIRDIVPQEYLDARKFLDRLSLEGRFPVG